ncbi:MAG: type II secretion system ATPase GspE, partial [Gammaproteobacteria bacterium]
MNVPFAFARRHGVFVRGAGGDDELAIVFRANAPVTAVSEAQRLLGRAVRLDCLADDDFERELQMTYERDAQDNGGAMAAFDDALDLAEIAQELGEPTDLLESADDAPIIRLINGIISEAIRENASDIHIEPFESRLSIRLRVDGVLRQVMEPPSAIAALLVSRIKIMAKLDIAEKRVPQDGRISLRIANRPVDVRVSTIPSGSGERVVLRLLDKQAGRLKLEQIGMDGATTAAIDRIIHMPHGIFLVTGPTGSGKTTTLYAALTRINDRSRNLMTVEDPIEYYIDGIAQTQVNTRVEMTFARGLRAILRQDPDVVMVGEIRDLETASIAIQASLTGHLVLSTLHTNSAIGAIARLRDMGTEPFLLASSLVGVLAQRLVRKLCPQCRVASAADAALAARLAMDLDTLRAHTVYEPAGCPHCMQIGYRGRSAIYELVTVDTELRRLIHDDASEPVLETHARRSSPSLFENGRAQVLAGVTSAEELIRGTTAAGATPVPAFDYLALDAAGARRRGIAEADSEAQARQRLREQGLVPLEIRATRRTQGSAGGSLLAARGPHLSGDQVVLFTRLLGTLLQSGLPLDDALTGLARQTGAGDFKRVALEIRARVLEGQGLAAGLDQFPRSFPSVYR